MRLPSILVAIILGALVTNINSPAAADGALAVGYTGDIAKDGLSIGYKSNAKNMSEAKEIALKECKEDGVIHPLRKRAAAQCRQVATFQNECLATSLDPKAGTPGWGWAIAADSATAKDRAIESCKTTAGAERRQFCIVDTVKCDGTAK